MKDPTSRREYDDLSESQRDQFNKLSEFKKFYDGDIGGFIDYCRDKMENDSVSLT